MAGETEKEILLIIEEAIKREKAAQALYIRGAQLAVHPEIKQVFVNIAKEEKKHESLLSGIYHEYKKKLGLKVLHNDGEE